MFTKDKLFYEKLWKLMLPMMLQNLMLALVAVADAFMLGGMDQNYMSAVSLATQIQFIQNMLLSAATGGLAILGASLFWGVGFTSYSSFMGHLGVDATAANSVAAVVRDIICCLSAGISGAAGIMVGNELGAGNLERGKLYGTRMLKISFICGVIMTVLMGISAPFILMFVKLTPQAATYLKGMFIVICVYMIGRSVNEITINGVFGSGGDTMFDVYSLAVTMWGIAIPLAALGTYKFHWPVIVVYACTCVDEVGKIPWTIYHFRKYKWVKDLTHTER